MGPLEEGARRLADALRADLVPPDEDFDALLPAPLAAASAHLWTPVAVAVQAARWLDEVGARSVVDIGSGVGKLSIVAALAGGARHHGLEHRPRLVAIARALAAACGVAERVSFEVGALALDRLPCADAYYLYNPFGENVAEPDEQLDRTVTLDAARRARDIALTEELLRAAPRGTYALVYNGFGGRMPRGYESVRYDLERPEALRLWRRSR